MKMASLKDISERYKRVCESFIKKTVKTGLKDKGDSVFKLPENYIEIALMKIIESRGIEEVDIDYSEILQENPIDKSKWVPTLVYIDTDDTLGVRWDKFLAYNTECGCIDVYENSDTYESFYGQDEYVQTELYREVIDALGMEYVEPETMYYQTLESFVGHVSRKRNSDLISDIDYPDGVYVLHETLGLRSVEGWNIKDNQGVVGVVIIDPRQNLVISKNDSPMKLTWSVSEYDGRNKEMNVNKKLKRDVAKTDLQGEKYAIKLRERIGNCPASDYCLGLKDGGREWYLPSAGQMFLIYDYINDVQNALIEVGGHPLYTGNIGYWTSTERTFNVSFEFNFGNGQLYNWSVKNTSKLFVRPVSTFDYDRLEESFTRKTSKTKDEELRTRADESVLPKNYIDLALMSVLCSAKKEGICFRKPKFRYKDDFGDVYELSEIFLQNDGFEIGSYEQNHYLEIEWNVYENGYMEEEPVSDVYPFKDEDNEIKTEIYKRVLRYLGMEYVSPNIRWMEFDDEGFDYFDN